jgi:hypothetical protein
LAVGRAVSVLRRVFASTALVAAAACGRGDAPAVAATQPDTTTASPLAPATLALRGRGTVSERFTAEVWVRGSTAYTTTWGTRGLNRGNAVKIWDVSAQTPVLVDSLIVSDATTLGDVQVSDDGALLVVAIEANPHGGLAIYSLADPRRPALLVRTTGGELQYGVHTAEVARVGGVLHVFCSVDPANGVPARLVVLDLTNPATPRTVWSQAMGAPIVHDVFVRDGLLFTAEWDDGVGIWDIGAQGGSVTAPRRLSRLQTVGGQVHNVWWVHDSLSGSKRWLLVGEEGPGATGSTSSGDVHVVDVADLSAPREVAAFRVAGAGTHNFSVDERQGIAYIAFYNGGVRAIDVRGDLGTCSTVQRLSDGRCDLGRMGRELARFVPTTASFVWGVHVVPGGVFASDMLNGLVHLAPHVR